MFADIATPSYVLTKKNITWTWSLECQKAFESLKQKLTSPPLLAFPDFQLPFMVDTDASGYGVGAILSQEKNDMEHIIAYASRLLKTSEKNYSTTDRELLA